MMKNYFVIIGDIVSSRQIEDRAHVQTKFSAAIETLKRNNKKMFLSPPTLTIGDEFQAVLKSTTNLFLRIHQFEAEMSPVQLRFGLGLGKIDTPINTKAAIGMDGSAFHNARRAIETARNEKRKYVLFSSIEQEQSLAWQLILRWIDLTLQGWSMEKQQILILNRMGKRQKEIASLLHITQPAVSQHINKKNFSLIVQSEEFLENRFNKILTGD